VKPTAEQVAEARKVVRLGRHALRRAHIYEIPSGMVAAIDVILVATEPPTDEELARERNDWAWHKEGDPIGPIDSARLHTIYRAGARREGLPRG
jgi:hypothetical protein